MPQIIVHRMVDLPAEIAVPIGESESSSQRFNVIRTPMTRRLYVVRATGFTEPGVYQIKITPLTGETMRSLPITILPDHLKDPTCTMTAEIVGPSYGEFVVDLDRIAEIQFPQLVPDVASTPAAEA